MNFNKDGFARNIAKIKSEWSESRAYMVPHWDRFLHKPDTHAYVNLFVESRRHSPYLWGHVDALLYPIIIVLLFWSMLE
jgi:hypothetical protein